MKVSQRDARLCELLKNMARNANAAIDDVRALEDFPAHLLDQIERDIATIRTLTRSGRRCGRDTRIHRDRDADTILISEVESCEHLL